MITVGRTATNILKLYSLFSAIRSFASVVADHFRIVVY